MLVQRVEELLHLLLLQELGRRIDRPLVLGQLQFLLSRLVNKRTAEQRLAEFEAVDTATMVSNKQDWILRVEGHVQTVCLLHGAMLAQVSVLLLVQIPDEEAATNWVVCACSEHCRAIRCPLDVTDRILQIERHDRASQLHIPEFDGPISGAREEDARMEMVPLDRIHAVVMTLVGLEVLAGVSLRAQVDLALFSSDQEQMRLILVEVEAHTASKAIHERLLFA